MIQEFYKDKTILITGGTGFLGKVVVEKFFRTIPNIKRMFLLVRPKKGVLIMDRVKREIFQSQCFDIVRGMPHFEKMIAEKVVPIEGDITKDYLALKPEDKQRLTEELQVIINCAASVDFNERLCDAINVNYKGCLRMLDLAHQCPRLEIFTHVSTAYVNCEKKGFIKEQIYDINDDSETLINSIEQMTPEEQDAKLKDILGNWPNTYTFTKSMGERTLRKRRNPNLPVVLLRPSIISSSLKEPMPGWTDTLSAAGGLSFAGGIGIINFVHGNEHNIADLVPVDLVSNAIIVSTAMKAKRPQLTIVHAGTSHSKPLTWHYFMQYIFSHIKNQPFDLQIFKPSVYWFQSPTMYKFMFYMKSELPVKVLEKVSKIPGIGSAQLKKNIEKAKKLNKRSHDLGTMFDHFTNNQWIFETGQIYEFLKNMTHQERIDFWIDPKEIDWPSAIRQYAYGIQKFIMKQESILPDSEQTTLVRKNSFEYFEDVRWAFFDGQPILSQNIENIRKDVLNSTILQKFIQKELHRQVTASAGKPKTDSQMYSELMKQADKHLKEIEAQLKPSVVRPTLWFFQKVWQKVYDQIIVNESQLKELRKLLENKSVNVILLPTHKSYMDFILLGYIHYHFKLDYPFVCGDDALFSLAIISFLIKSTNGFHLNSQSMKSGLYQAVIESYIYSLMKHNCLLEIFLEQRRSRSGKIKKPTEVLFDHLIKVFLQEIDGQQREKKDIILIPVTINYDRIHEGESFPLELLGETPHQESLVKVLRQFAVVNRPLGKVNIKYCEPISLKQYIEKHSVKNNIPIKDYKLGEVATTKLIRDIGQELSYQQVENLVIMSTSLVAAILLMHRKGISHDLLIRRVAWLYEEIKARKGDLNLSQIPSSAIIQSCLTYLSGFVDRKRDIFEPSVSAKKGQKNILMLAYYRNNLIHLFINDAEIACTILGFNSISDISKGVSLDAIWNRVCYLRDLLSDEFVIRKTMKTKDDFLNRVKLMHSRDCVGLNMDEQTLFIDPNNENQQYSQSFLYHLLLPFIESYWITITYFIVQENRKHPHEEDILYNKVQWVIETLYRAGLVKFYESCMLESIKNAIQKYAQMGILTKQVVTQQRQQKVFYKLDEAYMNDDKFNELYESVMFYLPYQPNMNYHRIQSEIRKIMISDIQLLAKL